MSLVTTPLISALRVVAAKALSSSVAMSLVFILLPLKVCGCAQ